MELGNLAQSLEAVSTAENGADDNAEENEPSELVLEGLSFELAILNEKDWWDFRQRAATKAKHEVANFLQKVKELEAERIQAQLAVSNDRCVQPLKQIKPLYNGAVV